MTQDPKSSLSAPVEDAGVSTKTQPDAEGRLHVLQYYPPVFARLHHDHGDAINVATAEARATRRAHWSDATRVGNWTGEKAWALLHEYLKRVESMIESIVVTHSHYFWIHLYRRLGVGLHPDLDNARDARTIALVRNILEQAFVLYGRLGDDLRDIALSAEVPFAEVAGGLLLQELTRVVAAGGVPETSIEAYAEELRRHNQWVLTKFAAADFVNIYRLEALAYEYWLTTARMRRVGKGGAIVVPESGEIASAGSSADPFEGLIKNYDARIEAVTMDASSIGVAFYMQPTAGALQAVLASYNVEHRKLSEIALSEELRGQTDLVSNFVIAPVALSAFANSHAFAERAYRSARGFPLKSFCGYIAALAQLEIASALGGASEESRVFGLLQLYQRAYVTRTEKHFEDVTEAAVLLMDAWVGAGNHTVREDAPLIRKFLTLTKESRGRTGLWSLGPRYAFLQHGPAIIVDLEGLAVILRNAFYGVPHDQGAKGVLFEEEFRRFVVDSNLQLLPYRVLDDGVHNREADALVRVGNTLFVCECRAMERPLDFELGRIRTIAKRTEDLGHKVEQALSLGEFIRKTPAGTNYDLSWATDVVPLVVSPFVEWIWEWGPALWLNDSTPRVLSATEAVNFMKGKDSIASG